MTAAPRTGPPGAGPRGQVPLRALDMRIHGIVQGVGYRWSTTVRARELGVAGWVRNEADGTVSAHLEGPASSVSTLVEWMGRGPDAAQVTRVDAVEAALQGYQEFTTVH